MVSWLKSNHAGYGPCKNGHDGKYRYKPDYVNYVICRACTKAADKKARDKLRTENPKLLEERSRRNNLRVIFNIELEDYESMLKQQNYVCAICNRPETTVVRGKLARLAVDHDHKTGKIRQLLCGKCNKALGLFDESVDIMLNAIEYVRKHAST